MNEAQILREELKRMQSEYELRLKEMEAKLVELEIKQQIQQKITEQNKISPLQKASEAQPNSAQVDQKKQEISDSNPPKKVRQSVSDEMRDAEREFKRRTEIREMSNESPRAKARIERIENIVQNFVNINGYFRTGYGVASRGGGMEAFGINSALAKYRLGNEAENYGELIFSKTFFVPGTFDETGLEQPSGPIGQFNLRLSFYDPFTSSASTGADFGVPECWASIGRIIPGNPDVKFWAGSRFYYRYDLHLNDFFYYNMSGGGGGIEDWKVGPGKFALAWIGSANDNVLYSTYRETSLPIGAGNFSKWTLDARYYDFAIGKGNGMLGLDYSHQKSGVLSSGKTSPSYDGVALNFIYTRDNIAGEGSLHSLGFQAGTGPAKTFTTGFETFENSQGTYIQPQSDSSWRLRMVDQLILSLNEKFSLGTSAVYQYTDFAVDNGNQHWLSAGMRPVYFLNEWSSIALEAGYDWVSASPLSPAGGLFKLTLAPQVSWDGGFFGRPVLRAFATWGLWGKNLEGYVGGNDYIDRNQGLSFGVQMETWW